MKLHILRHAKTDDHSISGSDIDRELLPEGVEQSVALRSYFNSITDIETVWCSDAKRTRQTAEIILDGIHPDPDFELDLYLASKQALLQKIWSSNLSGDLLIIGHNFGISDLASYLTNERIELATADYVCIEFDCESWQEISVGTGTIVDHYRPRASS